MDTFARGEMVESKLDAFIARSDEERRRTQGERDREALWEASVRAYQARCGEDRRLARLEYHEGQARRLSSTLEALVAYHEAEAEKYRKRREEMSA